MSPSQAHNVSPRVVGVKRRGVPAGQWLVSKGVVSPRVSGWCQKAWCPRGSVVGVKRRGVPAGQWLVSKGVVSPRVSGWCQKAWCPRGSVVGVKRRGVPESPSSAFASFPLKEHKNNETEL